MPEQLLANLSTQKLKAVLTHELVHIKRRDLWLNTIQTILQVLYFYNPLLWLANAIIRQIREQAVDEATLANLGDEAKNYSSTLIDIAELALTRPHFSLRLVGVVESKKSLGGRIKHIASNPIPKSAKIGVGSLISIALMGMLLLPMAQGSVTQVHSITDILNVSDKSGFTIKSISIPPLTGKKGTVSITVAVENDSNSIMYLGLDYYLDLGNYTKLFSPGSSHKASIQEIPAKFKGDVQFHITNRRPANNAFIHVQLAKCPNKDSLDSKDIRFLSPACEIIWDKYYYFDEATQSSIQQSLTTESAGNTDNDFKKNLPNGATVELLGICDDPSGANKWWQADGNEIVAKIWRPKNLPEVKYLHRYIPESRWMHFAARCYGPDNPEILTFTFDNRPGSRGEFDVIGPKGDRSNWIGELQEFKKDQPTCIIRFAVAHGQFENRCTEKGRTPYGLYVISQGTSKQDGKTGVYVSTDFNGVEIRVVAIDKKHKWHVGKITSGRSTYGLTQEFYAFEDLSVGQENLIFLQTRPIEWVEFKNVALRPNPQPATRNSQQFSPPPPSVSSVTSVTSVVNTPQSVKSSSKSVPSVAQPADQNSEGQRNLIQEHVTKIKTSTGHKDAAFGLGPQIAQLDPNVGYEILMQAWPDLKNDDVKTGLVKAFVFADHPRAVDVIAKAVNDNSSAVRSYVFAYVPKYSGKDFDGSVSKFNEWYLRVKGAPVEKIRQMSVEMNRSEVKRLIAGVIDKFQAGKSLQELHSDLETLFKSNDPITIPYYIGMIDADNSYDSIYGIGYFGLRDFTNVEYSEFHDGAWWRRWWHANKSNFPLEAQQIPIPELRKTQAGSKHVPFPSDMDTLNGKLVWLVKQYKDGKKQNLSGIAGEIAKHNDPRSIPILIGVIAADNTYDTIYGIGYFGLNRLTGVQYSSAHNGKWWINWWQENKSQFPAQAQKMEIPDLSKPMFSTFILDEPNSISTQTLNTAPTLNPQPADPNPQQSSPPPPSASSATSAVNPPQSVKSPSKSVPSVAQPADPNSKQSIKDNVSGRPDLAGEFDIANPWKAITGCESQFCTDLYAAMTASGGLEPNETVIKKCQSFLDKYPDSPACVSVLNYMSSLYGQMGKTVKARVLLYTAIQKAGNDRFVNIIKLNEVHWLITEKQYAAALAISEEVNSVAIKGPLSDPYSVAPQMFMAKWKIAELYNLQGNSAKADYLMRQTIDKGLVFMREHPDLQYVPSYIGATFTKWTDLLLDRRPPEFAKAYEIAQEYGTTMRDTTESSESRYYNRTWGIDEIARRHGLDPNQFKRTLKPAEQN